MDSGLERLLGWKIEADKERKINIYKAKNTDCVEIEWILQASFLFIEDALEFLLRKIK